MTNGWHRKTPGTAAELARRARYATPEYRAMERALKAEVRAGRGHCWRCGGWIDPTARTPWGARAWHVGHDDKDDTIIRGAEHAVCNLRAAALAGVNKRNGGGGSTRLSF